VVFYVVLQANCDDYLFFHFDHCLKGAVLTPGAGFFFWFPFCYCDGD
jgi:hypothetical protein